MGGSFHGKMLVHQRVYSQFMAFIGCSNRESGWWNISFGAFYGYTMLYHLFSATVHIGNQAAKWFSSLLNFHGGWPFSSWTMIFLSNHTELMAFYHLFELLMQSKLKDFRFVFSCFSHTSWLISGNQTRWKSAIYRWFSYWSLHLQWISHGFDYRKYEPRQGFRCILITGPIGGGFFLPVMPTAIRERKAGAYNSKKFGFVTEISTLFHTIPYLIGSMVLVYMLTLGIFFDGN